MPLDAAFKRELLTKLAHEAAAMAYISVPSKTLRDNMDVIIDESTIEDRISCAYVYIPHYWALYVHDGRSASWEGWPGRESTFLVWFRDPKDDPRLRGGRYPVRFSEWRHLTPDEWKYWLGRNRDAKARGDPGPMIVVKHVSGVTGSFFFDNEVGMKGYKLLADLIIGDMFANSLRDELSRELRGETVGINLPLRLI